MTDKQKHDTGDNNERQQSAEEPKKRALPDENVDKPAGDTGTDEARNRSSDPGAARQ
ncbi:MAG TPA: hypothetical protein VG309_09790 [Rhizomicrobium sp.]|jgi:hypothetical protein|nr:hypothetical protein [Rhizomicrobium sp.]